MAVTLTTLAVLLLAVLLLMLCPRCDCTSSNSITGGARTQRVRKEIRSLSKSAWTNVVNAIRVMKYISEEEGRSIYGGHFQSYDQMVLQHISVATSTNGDLGHFSEVFTVFHRAWTLSFENSLIAINPAIKGLPYWDFQLDLQPEMGAPSAFSETYFGSTGDPADGYTVKDGPFAFWPIAFAADVGGGEYSGSPYGQLRHPVNINNNPYLTRRIGSLCGVKFQLGDASFYQKCVQNTHNISDFRLCVDGTIHGPAHLTIGGSWKRDSQKNVPGNARSCSQWYGQILPQVADPSTLPPLGSFISAFAAGCLVCPKTKCSLDENPDACVCTRSRSAPSSCGPLWSGLPDKKKYKATLAPCKDIQIIGDFVDAAASANDPIFPFHHANIDRVWANWLMKYDNQDLHSLNFFNYPHTGLGYGSNLHDPLSPDFPFVNLVDNYPLDNTPYTVRDVLEATFPSSNCPYRYQQTSRYTVPPTTSPTASPVSRSSSSNSKKKNKNKKATTATVTATGASSSTASRSSSGSGSGSGPGWERSLSDAANEDSSSEVVRPDIIDKGIAALTLALGLSAGILAVSRCLRYVRGVK